MSRNTRALFLDGDQDVLRELRRIEADEAGLRFLLPRTRFYSLKLESVNLPAAYAIKSTLLSTGGEAVMSRAVGSKETDILIFATLSQIEQALTLVREQQLGCNEIAEEIEAVIRNLKGVQVSPRVMADARLGRLFGLFGSRTAIMGILNVTPDSFSDGGSYADVKAAIEHAVKMERDGADIIDVGGESTRPGSEPVSAEDEIERVVPVIRELSQTVSVPISIDTFKASVASEALDAGASIVNDISGSTFDRDMPVLLAERRCPAVVMHIKGAPKSMQLNPEYEDLMREVFSYLRERTDALVAAGVDERLLIVDPGFGFGKTVEHNLEMLRRLRELKSLGYPVLVGTSRKSTIGKVLGDVPTGERMEGTAATVALAIANGADIVRVHDVKEMARVARMTDAVVRSR